MYSLAFSNLGLSIFYSYFPFVPTLSGMYVTQFKIRQSYHFSRPGEIQTYMVEAIGGLIAPNVKCYGCSSWTVRQPQWQGAHARWTTGAPLSIALTSGQKLEYRCLCFQISIHFRVRYSLPTAIDVHTEIQVLFYSSPLQSIWPRSFARVKVLR